MKFSNILMAFAVLGAAANAKQLRKPDLSAGKPTTTICDDGKCLTYPEPTFDREAREPYNRVLGVHQLLENSDLGFTFSNEELYDICFRELQLTQPSYGDLNRLVSEAMSSITSSLRFDKELNCDLSELSTSMVPYPRLHFMLSNYAPLQGKKMGLGKVIYSIAELTQSMFDAENMMAKTDPRHAKYMCTSTTFRGDVVPKDVDAAMTAVKGKRTFSYQEWIPAGFKVAKTSKKRVTGPTLNRVKTLNLAEKLSKALDTLFMRKASPFRMDTRHEMETGSFARQRAMIHFSPLEGTRKEK